MKFMACEKKRVYGCNDERQSDVKTCKHGRVCERKNISKNSYWQKK